MSTVHNGRLSTTTKYIDVVAIPELALEALHREYSISGLRSASSDSGGGGASSNARRERAKISRMEGCLITKQTGYYLKMAHWINVVRGGEEDGEGERSRAELEMFLQALHIVPLHFTLNSASNVTPLDRNLHYMLDKLGFFAVTCSKDTLKALIDIVDQENAAYIARTARGGTNYRYFPLHEAPFTTATYELVVLHPTYFLPRAGNAITISTERGADELIPKLYYVSPDGALREGAKDEDARLQAFASHRARAPGDMLNPFLVVLNAEVAFRRFRRDAHPRPLCKEYEELVDLTLELADKIYFQPVVDVFEAALKRSKAAHAPAPAPAEAGAGATPTPTRGDGGVRDDLSDETAAPQRKVNVGSTRKAAPRELARNSRMGIVVRPPGPNATHEEFMEYQRYLMSGCDYFDEYDEDEDEDEEDDYW